MSTSLRITLGQHSEPGADGGVNQDFHGALLPEGRLRTTKGVAVALADGIGSSAVSQVASAAAVRGFLDDYYATSEAWSVRRAAQRVLAATNSWLHAQTQRGDGRFDKDRGYVCTFSALVAKGRDVHLLHVGDGRICRLHAQALEPLTEDHRVQLSSQESYLGRALGASPHVEIDYRCLPAEAGAVYLLATDGVWAHIDAAAVHAALAAHGEDFDAACAALCAIARARGSDDDRTVQLLRIDALPDAADAGAALQQRPEGGWAMPPPLAPRSAFEGYTVVRPLHASARSHVFLAVDDTTGAQVALKTPAVELQQDAGLLDRFLLEEWVARRIDSPHVLKCAATPDRPRRHVFTAMEYVEGCTLSQWMTDYPRPTLDAVRAVVAQVARGLQAFHGREMLHQDLRPENVLVDRGGTVRIIDFGSVHVAGLAEAAPLRRGDAEDGRADSAHAVAGTLQYTAPECFTGAGVDARSDLFALAVLAYQMLSGQLPYGLNAARVRTPDDARRLRYVPLRHLRPELPAWLDAVLQKALHPDPRKRQEAVSEFVHDLHAPGPQFHRLRPPPLVERDPVRFWQATTVLLGVVAIVLAGLLVRAG
ncbi:bifunctional protein-serine/threonine kinase/phosphatase [uncultured Xylophilus sp.]|uniref:bifunctional protein-serine/threonine kinase/phosphatase n=1 Tax=uncultured Xylophilus sp. TaxID=296832 RepID=UPI0025CC60BE|nr:bifunctional protein-serine/threonine kinase/phosphatase [uncultured Xylophilus sp.]